MLQSHHMALKITREKYPYRQAVLGIIIDENKQFLIVQKLNYQKNEWSFAGGGIEKDETPKQAVVRELEEELGSKKFKVVAESKIPYSYEWPEQVILKQYRKAGKFYRGALIKYFLVKFFGKKEELKLQADELRAIKWVKLEELPKHLIFPSQWYSAKKVLKELL